MHPPPFRPAHRLSDWPDCCLELHCCRGATVYPVRLLIKNSGDRTFADTYGHCAEITSTVCPCRQI